MKTVAMLAFIAVAILGTWLVMAADRNDRPSSVAETDWIPISERFGFVIERKDTPPAAGNLSPQLLLVPQEAMPAELLAPVKGYFVVKTDSGWRRLTVLNPVELSRL